MADGLAAVRWRSRRPARADPVPGDDGRTALLVVDDEPDVASVAPDDVAAGDV